MNDFEISIKYKGTEHRYIGELITYGFSHKIVMQLDDISVVFEPDEERNYRAVVAAADQNGVDPVLLQLIAGELELSLK